MKEFTIHLCNAETSTKEMYETILLRGLGSSVTQKITRSGAWSQIIAQLLALRT